MPNASTRLDRVRPQLARRAGPRRRVTRRASARPRRPWVRNQDMSSSRSADHEQVAHPAPAARRSTGVVARSHPRVRRPCTSSRSTWARPSTCMWSWAVDAAAAARAAPAAPAPAAGGPGRRARAPPAPEQRDLAGAGRGRPRAQPTRRQRGRLARDGDGAERACAPRPRRRGAGARRPASRFLATSCMSTRVVALERGEHVGVRAQPRQPVGGQVPRPAARLAGGLQRARWRSRSQPALTAAASVSSRRPRSRRYPALVHLLELLDQHGLGEGERVGARHRGQQLALVRGVVEQAHLLSRWPGR